MPVFGSIASFSSSLAAGKSGPGRPGLPAVGTPTRVNGSGTSVDVPFTAPASNGGVPITSYTAVSSPGGITGTLNQSGSGTIRVSGLTAGITYTFTVYATNSRGNSPNTTSSSSVVPATVPEAPIIGTATTTGQTTATISFTAPTNNGSAITSYTAVSSPGGITATLNQSGSGTITVSGLTAGTAYTFTVYATNSLGNSLTSSSSNSITTDSAIPPPNVEYLLVAGGGGGGGQAGGGGGAGGFRTGPSLSVSASVNYTISVGAGGAGASSNASAGSKGVDSYISGSTITESPSGAGTNTIRSYGGGGGASRDGGPSGGSGGSGGGGAGGYQTGGGVGNSPATSPSQGNTGGGGTSNQGTNSAGGGGGGATQTGTNGATSAGGKGGNGASSSISGVSVTYAGGGGGGTIYDTGFPGGAGGTGGGGTGGVGIGCGTSGSPNTGGGGGGTNCAAPSLGAGGSGIVIIAYSSSYASLASVGAGLISNGSGGNTSPDTSSRPGYKVYKFTGGTGTISW